MAVDFSVTRRRLMLGARDAITGWYAKSFAESTIDMVLVPQGANNLSLKTGVYARLDAVGLTQDVVLLGDEIETVAGIFYEVKTVKEHWVGDSFEHRECDLTELPMHG